MPARTASQSIAPGEVDAMSAHASLTGEFATPEADVTSAGSGFAVLIAPH